MSLLSELFWCSCNYFWSEVSVVFVHTFSITLWMCKNSGIHSKVVVWITLLRVDPTILSVDVSTPNEVILIMTPKRVDFHKWPFTLAFGSGNGNFLSQKHSGIYSQKSDSNHYFGVDSTFLTVWFPLFWQWISTPNEVIANMTPKRVDFHSTNYHLPSP